MHLPCPRDQAPITRQLLHLRLNVCAGGLVRCGSRGLQTLLIRARKPVCAVRAESLRGLACAAGIQPMRWRGLCQTRRKEPADLVGMREVMRIPVGQVPKRNITATLPY